MLKSILTALIVVQSIFASDLKFSFDGDIGYVPRTVNAAYKFTGQYSWIEKKDVFFLTLSPKLDFKFIYGILSVSTFSCKTDRGVTFHPFRAVFENEFGLYKQFSDIQVSVYWKHQCSHSIVVQNNEDQKPDLFDNAYDKIALKFSYKN